MFLLSSVRVHKVNRIFLWSKLAASQEASTTRSECGVAHNQAVAAYVAACTVAPCISAAGKSGCLGDSNAILGLDAADANDHFNAVKPLWTRDNMVPTMLGPPATIFFH